MIKRRKKKKVPRKILTIVGVVIFILFLIGYVGIYMPYNRIRTKGEKVEAAAKELKHSFSKNDLTLMKKQMAQMEQTYGEFEKAAGSIYWASFLPQVRDFRNGVAAGKDVIDAGNKTIIALEPYAELLGFEKGEKSFEEKSSEERIQTAILTLDTLSSSIDEISKDVQEAEEKINTIDPENYPEQFAGKKIRENVVDLKQQFGAIKSVFVDAKPFMKQLPEILGKDEEKKYLILFQNQYEQRATGGFLTAYAVLKINEGKIELEDSTNIYDLDDSVSEHPDAPEKIEAYHKDVSKFYIRDSNLSPDFPTSIKLFEEIYDKSSSKIEYDGIITMDAEVLVDMLEIYGETEANGMTFSAEKDERCDCPQVIYTIFDTVGRPVGYIKADRKGILGDLMFALFNKALGLSPTQYWPKLSDMVFTNLDEKHILLYFKDEESQNAVEALNWAGRIRSTEGDYLSIVNVNFAGQKSNLFVRENISSYTVFQDDQIKRTVTIEFRNPSPHSDCNLERGGLCLNATLRNWIRFYVPKGSTLDSFEGSETEVLTYDELGKTVYEGFMRVTPEGKAVVTVEYTLPKDISREDYSLLLQKQAGEEEQELEVYVEKKKVYDGSFDMDRELPVH